MSNANRDYAIVYDVKNSSLVLSRPLIFYITDKNTSNIFIKLVTKVSTGNEIDKYTDMENASNYVLTMRVIKPNNEVKSLEATQHESESVFQFDLTEDFKDIPGKYICELTISTIVSSRQELITSDPFSYEVKRSILSNVGEIIETEDITVEKLLNDLDATKAEISSQIKDKVNRNEGGVITNAMLSQEVKEGMTGGSVAVVGKNSVLNENVVDGAITYNKTDFLITGKNLFNKDTVSSKGWYMQYTDGVPVQNEYVLDFCYSDFIKVRPSSTVTINNYLHSYCLYDVEKNFIEGKFVHVNGMTIQIPSNCEYIVVNTTYDAKDTTQVEYGAVATSYEPYTLDVKFLKANTDIKALKKELNTDVESLKKELNTDVESLNTDIDILDKSIDKTNLRLNELTAHKEISIDTGTATTPRNASSIFTGWGLPFKKADLKGDITYISVYAVAYDNGTDGNLITNVPVNLELIQGSGLEVSAQYRPVLKVLSTSVLKESGKVEFKLSLPLDELDDVFYLAVRATTPCNLQFWKCKSNPEYTFGDYPVIYSINSSTTVDNYAKSTDTDFATTDFKIGTGYSASISKHKHKAEDIEGIEDLFSKHKHKAEDIEGIEDLLGASKVKLSLPDKYELVVGDTFELFYKGILLCNNPYIYNFKITCNKGACYSKRYIFTPNSSDIGTHNLRIEVYDDNENLLDSKLVQLIVKNKPSSPSSVQNVLCVGDSLTDGGEWPSEVCRRLTGTGGTPIADGLSNINFIGTRNGTNGAKYEGYGGWTYDSYNTSLIARQQYWINTTANKNNSYQKSVWKDSNNIEWVLETLEETRIKVYRKNYGTQMLPSSGTLTWVSGGNGSDNNAISYTSYITESGNPFWNNDTNKVDFSTYATKLGVSSIDHCYVLLGWNQTGNTETEFKNNARVFINNLLASFPTCKITLMGLQVPSLDGCGTNYGCGWNFYDKLKVVFNMNKWNYDLAQEFANVDFINIAGQFDSENNILTSTRQVNVRNSKTEVYGSNGVHPAYSGYMQIADAVYRNLSHKL